MSRTRRLLTRASNQITKVVGMYWGEAFPFYHVCEFPKSGGSWFGKMAAHCLQIPYPQWPVFPLGFRCVVHTHWRYIGRLRRVCYVYRDGRDVMVSLYFHRMRGLAQSHPGIVRTFRKRYDRLFGKGYDPDDSVRLLPRFLENEFKRPQNERQTWPEHLEGWYGETGRPHVTYVRYEDLLADCAGTLRRAVESVSGRTIDPWLIDNAVETWSMKRQTGRRPGEEDRSSFVRKGIAGDWVHHFSAASARLFDERAGDMLVRLGYEPDRDWVGRYDLADA